MNKAYLKNEFSDGLPIMSFSIECLVIGEEKESCEKNLMTKNTDKHKLKKVLPGRFCVKEVPLLLPLYCFINPLL